MTLTERIEKVLALDVKRTQGEWEWFTSCSTKRLSADNHDGKVAYSYVASDGLSDINIRKEDMDFIEAAPEMIAIIREQKAELERLRLYAVHKHECGANKPASWHSTIRHLATSFGACDCGLNDMLGR